MSFLSRAEWKMLCYVPILNFCVVSCRLRKSRDVFFWIRRFRALSAFFDHFYLIFKGEPVHCVHAPTKIVEQFHSQKKNESGSADQFNRSSGELRWIHHPKRFYRNVLHKIKTNTHTLFVFKHVHHWLWSIKRAHSMNMWKERRCQYGDNYVTFECRTLFVVSLYDVINRMNSDSIGIYINRRPREPREKENKTFCD